MVSIHEKLDTDSHKHEETYLTILNSYLFIKLNHDTTRKIESEKSISSRPEVFCRIGVLRNFAKFTPKHLSQSLFFNKVASLRPATLVKKRLWLRCFPMNFAKFLRTPFLTEQLRWMLLYLVRE